MSEKYCSNCCKNINAATFFLHERMCSINVKKCPKCRKPFTVDDLEDHIQEVHTEVECEYCKKKYVRSEIDKHKNTCDSKLVSCPFCELSVLLGELKEHQKACGAITEPCIKCKRYIQRKDMDKHLMDGCPPPKNDRRSVDVIRNDSRLSSSKKNDNIINNIYNNYIPININDYIPDEIFFEEDKKKVDIKMHNNISKPNLQIRPPSGRKILNEKAKESSSKIGNINNNSNNNINNIFNDKETNIKPTNIKEANNTKTKTKKYIKKETDKNKTKVEHKDKKPDYLNKQTNSNKQAILIKPTRKEEDKKIKVEANDSMNNSRYNIRDNKKKKSSKPDFNITKGSMKISKEKQSEEEFRKSRDKFTFREAKNISGKNLNKNIANNNKININNNNKKPSKLINEADFLANFNFGDVGDDEQIMQAVIEQSLKEQKKK